MQLDFADNLFTVRCSYGERGQVESMGFKWSSADGRWYTDSPRVAAGLRRDATPEALSKLRLIRILPWSQPLPSESEGLRPYQKQALSFALERSASYLGLDPGLGKTPVAAVAAEACAAAEGGLAACLYVSPPFLVRNVVREFRRWAPRLKVGVLTSKTAAVDMTRHDVVVLPDTFLSALWLPLAIRDFVRSFPSRFLIVDEAHRFKNDAAMRTRGLIGDGKRKGINAFFNRSCLMSGTPMPNRPVELYAPLNAFAPETIGWRTYQEYGVRYCDGEETEFGWDFTGASNTQELRRQLVAPEGPYMFRLRKKDVLDLPPKIEQVFLLSETLPPSVVALDYDVTKAWSAASDVVKAKLAESVDRETSELPLATYRKLLGELKSRAVTPYLRSILEETNENILVLAFHKKSIDVLTKGLRNFDPIVITGQTPSNSRQSLVDRYQEDTAKRVIIANYLAIGVGFTITKADRVVCVEFSWVPGENDQATDRAHRIGRTEPVLVEYVTYEGSLDEAVVRSNLNKRRTINQI